jgi:hypothetical protein
LSSIRKSSGDSDPERSIGDRWMITNTPLIINYILTNSLVQNGELEKEI